MAEYEIKNNESLNRFETQVDGVFGFLEYAKKSATIALLHTEVPPEIGGRGIAQALAVHAFEYAKANDLKVIIYCPFVAVCIKRHPEWDNQVLKINSQ